MLVAGTLTSKELVPALVIVATPEAAVTVLCGTFIVKLFPEFVTDEAPLPVIVAVWFGSTIELLPTILKVLPLKFKVDAGTFIV